MIGVGDQYSVLSFLSVSIILESPLLLILGFFNRNSFCEECDTSLWQPHASRFNNSYLHWSLLTETIHSRAAPWLYPCEPGTALAFPSHLLLHHQHTGTTPVKTPNTPWKKSEDLHPLILRRLQNRLYVKSETQQTAARARHNRPTNTIQQ